MKMKWVVGLILWVILSGGTALAQESQPLTLEESIRIALDRNLTLQIATLGVAGSEFSRMSALTQFFPTWTGQYGYVRYNTPATIGSSSGALGGSSTANDTYAFSTTVNQPLYTGGLISANYRSASLGVDISKTNVETVKRNLILQVRQGYYNILTAQKVLEVSQQSVKQFEAQLEVAQAFFDVGIVAKNDVLLAEVQLAQARQNQVNADNALALAKSSFNSLLRRDINAPLSVEDILDYKPSGYTLESSFEEALRQRPEIKAAELSINQAREAVNIAKSGYFPTISLAGNYGKTSDEANLDGRWGERWTVQTLATIAFSDWWRLGYKVGQSKVQVLQAQETKYQVIDNIVLEVKQNYINMVQAEKNIVTAQKSIEQAEENLRLNEERYKYQVSTATDLLNAVTLLAQARLNYYSALGVYNIAKASLERAMGRMYP
ncbi:MAG: TolC family protein [Deltaproteobacteria bacterium]